MTEQGLTPTQNASRQLVEAVIADPALRARFEMMAKDAANRVPEPDDFSWLVEQADRPDEFRRFEKLTKELLAVSKARIDAARSKRR